MPETPPERDLPVAVVDHRAGFGGSVLEVLGEDAEVLTRAVRSATQKQSQSKLVNIHL